MRSSSTLLPLLAGAVLGVASGLLGQRWLFGDDSGSRDSSGPSHQPTSAMGSSSNGVPPHPAGSDAPARSEPSRTAPVTLHDWLSLVEPLDAEATADRLNAALASFDLDALQRLCDEANTAFGQNNAAYAPLARALAKRACELGRQAFMDRAFAESGWLWASMRNHLVVEHAKTDFAAAATVLDRPLRAPERSEMWALLAGAKMGRSLDDTWIALREAFAQHATSAEQANGLEKTLDNTGLSQLALLFPAEMKAWLKEKKARMGYVLNDEERQWWQMASYRIDATAARTLTADESTGISHRDSLFTAKQFSMWREGVVTLGSIHDDMAACLADHWAEQDPQAGADWLLTLGENPAAAAEGVLFSRWADRDAKAAADWLVAHPSVRLSSETAVKLTRALAASDPGAVTRLLETFDSAIRPLALLGAADQLGRSDPAAATRAVLALPDWANRTPALKAITETVARSGASEGLTWVRSLPNELQADAVGALIATLAIQEPALAAEAVSAWTEAGGTVDEVGLVAVAKDWTAGAPEDAAAWADALPPGKAQDHATRAVAVTWARLDVEAAREWIDGLPDSQVKRDCQQLVDLR